MGLGVQRCASVPRKLAVVFDIGVAEARKSSAHARRMYPVLLNHYQDILSSDASVPAKQAAYASIKEVHELASQSARSSSDVPNSRTASRVPISSIKLSFTSFLPVIALLAIMSFTLFLGPGMEGFFGEESVSEALRLSNSSSTTLSDGIPPSLVFSSWRSIPEVVNKELIAINNLLSA